MNVDVATYGMEQRTGEIVPFLARMTELGVQSMLEIGTGMHAGLARYCFHQLGWDVTSVDVRAPVVRHPGHLVIVTPGTFADFDRRFDLVFVDAVHTYESVKADHAHYARYADKVVAFHDIHNPHPTCEGAGRYWQELVDSEAWAEMHEHVGPRSGPRAGIGWYEVTK